MINRQMDEESVLDTDNRISFGLKKERNSDTCYNMDETWGHAKWKNQSQKDKCYMIPLVYGM